MAARFVIGRAGSGKTRRCVRAIVRAVEADPLGPPIYWLVPRQSTFSAERELTAALGAFCRARVASFEEFGRDVFDDCGGSAIPHVSALGRQMILAHLLRQNRARLKFFSRVARQPGLAAELDHTLAELERAGQSADDLATAIAALSESNGADLELAPLLDKLHDVRLLYGAYVAYLGQDRLDQHRRLLQVQAALAECSFLKRCAIYVDGFIEFTDFERRTLVGAARAGATIEVTLTIDPASPTVADPHHLPDEFSLFRRTEESYRRLHFAFAEADVPLANPVFLGDVHRFQAPALSALELSLFHDPPASADDDAAGLAFIEAVDRAGEVDAVARSIRELVAGGHRFRDIGVLVRNLDHYHGLIDASFQEHGIPHFADRRRTAAHHPLLRLVRAILQIGRHDWPHEAVMTSLRSGLAGVDRYDADAVENYVLAHRIRGAAGWESPGPWAFRRRLLGAEDDQDESTGPALLVESARRRLLDALGPLPALLRGDGPRPLRQWAADIFGVLERLGVRVALSRLARSAADAGQLEQAAEHDQVWASLVDLFEQMVELLGDEPLSPAEFHDVLESGLDGFDLALAPPTVDQVLVGQADRTRTSQFRVAFVLGLNDGEFPRATRDGSILNDGDRRWLRQRRIELEPGAHQHLLDERFVAYSAFTRAAERLIVSRPMADHAGRPTEPSSFWRRLRAAFPAAPITTVPPLARLDPAQIATPRQLVTALMRWVRASPDPMAADGAAGPWPALYQWLAGRAETDKAGDPVDALRQRAWPALAYANPARLAPAIASEMFHAPLSASVAQLETFAACPFHHFVRYGLGLRRRERQEVTARDLGQLYHDLLEAALGDVLRRRKRGHHAAPLEQAIDRVIEQIGGALRDEVMLASARNRYLLERTRRNLHHFALSQREALRRGSFRPAHVGVTFGSGGRSLPALRLSAPTGGEVLLHGKIDRIDRAEGSDDVAVFDYRLGHNTLSIGMVLHGLSLQLLTDLLVLQAGGQRLAGRPLDPAAAFYLPLLRRIEDVKHPSESPEPTDPKWLLKLKPRGLFDRRCLGALDHGLGEGASEVVQAFVRRDGTLGHRTTTDVAESAEFRQLLELVARKLGELAGGVLSGRIDVAPYRLNHRSPCANCDYRAVCRFDQTINTFNYLEPIDRGGAFDAAGRAGGGDE